MGMVVRTNTMALNAYRQLGMNNSAVAKSLEKLSSGFRINRAADDAAGLAISEKMKAQIKGLETASSNAQDGISLIQTAEGNLSEVHNMLNRMVELATKSANGIYSQTERDALQDEVGALLSEINRISKSANFNGIELLNGNMEATPDTVTSTDITVDAVKDGDQPAKEQIGEYKIDLSQVSYTATADGKSLGSIKIGGQDIYEMNAAGDALDTNKVTMPTAAKEGDKITGTEIANALNNKGVEIDGVIYKITADGTTLTLKGLKAPDAADAQTTALTFEIAQTAAGDFKDIQGEGIAVHVITAPQAGGDVKLAQGEFALTADMVKDGQTLTIGKDTYTFKVGADSKVKDGANVIDLSAYEEGDAALLAAAGDKLSENGQTNNSQFIIATDHQGTIRLTEKKDTVDYADYDLKGTDADTGDATWKKLTGDKGSIVTWGKVNEGTGKKGLILQIGDTAEDFNQLTVSIKDMSTKGLSIDNVDISTYDGATAAIQTVKDAINTVSSERAKMGAVQNRLEYTINNLDVAVENLSAANSRIRDTDMAKEMMNYTKMNVLVQSAQAMLAQANQQPQSVLQLLQ